MKIEVRLRNAQEEDAQTLIDFLKITAEETKYLIREPEEIDLTLEDEKKFIQFQNESKHNLLLLAFLDGEYIGNCCLNGNSAARFAHRAALGIALYQKYTNQGIGTQMMKTLIEIARELNYKQIELEVVADNHRAIGLYKKMGFEIYGTFPNNMKYKDGSYAEA